MKWFFALLVCFVVLSAFGCAATLSSSDSFGDVLAGSAIRCNRVSVDTSCESSSDAELAQVEKSMLGSLPVSLKIEEALLLRRCERYRYHQNDFSLREDENRSLGRQRWDPNVILTAPDAFRIIGVLPTQTKVASLARVALPKKKPGVIHGALLDAFARAAAICKMRSPQHAPWTRITLVNRRLAQSFYVQGVSLYDHDFVCE